MKTKLRCLAGNGWTLVRVVWFVLVAGVASCPAEDGKVVQKMLLDGKYLTVATATAGPKTTLRIEVEGKLVRKGDLVLAHASGAEASVSIPVEEFQGKEAIVTMTNVPVDSMQEKALRVTPDIVGTEPPYRERLRPQFHFSARQGWLNDPNGLLYEGGRWHLFYQHNAFGFDMANQSWGHAVSTDLTHWHAEPEAIWMWTTAKEQAWSGSAVIDRQNRSGFGADGKPPMVAVFTDHDVGESLAYSRDGGQSFTRWEGGPLIQHRGRDPKVFWYPPEQSAEQKEGHWVMAVYDEGDHRQSVDLYVSEDLKKWEKTDRLDGFFECAELTPVPVVDAAGKKTGRQKWVAWSGNARYLLGDFDGRVFHPVDGQKQQTEFGAVYASQRWNDAPDGRIVQIFWMRTSPQDSRPMVSAMSVPLELTLREAEGGLRLFANPVKELDALDGRVHEVQPQRLAAGAALKVADVQGQQFDVRVNFGKMGEGKVRLVFGNDAVVYDAGSGKLTVGDQGEVTLPPAVATGDTMEWRVLVDRTSLEVFVGGGARYVVSGRKDAGKDVGVMLQSEIGDGLEVQDFRVAEVASIWPAEGSAANAPVGTDFADFYHGQLPELTVAGGGNQSGAPGSTLTEPLGVKVGGGLQNAPVTFTVTEGEARLTAGEKDETPVTTLDVRAVAPVAGSPGNYAAQVYVQMPAKLGSASTITATVRSGEKTVEVHATERISDPALKPPLNFRVVSNTATTSHMEWVPSDPTLSTVVEISYDKGATWKEAATFPPGATSGTLSHLTPDHFIYTRVFSRRDDDHEEPKAKAAVTPQP